MCALTAGQRGKRVLVLDRANKVGKKILMSGGGRCNFTNLYVEPERYLSANPHFCKSALSRYTQWHFIELVEQHQIAYHEKTEGQLFCDQSSKQVVAMLLAECEAAGVDIKTRCETQAVEYDGQFLLRTNGGDYSAPALVIATGGLSIPKLGGSGFGYELASGFGHQLLPTRAGLVPFTFTDQFRELSDRLSGVSLAAELRCGQTAFNDDILFTHRGLSGPAVLQLSSYWREGQIVQAKLTPDTAWHTYLSELKLRRPKVLLRTVLIDRLPKRLVAELELLWWSDLAEQPLAQWPDRRLHQLAERLSEWSLKPAGTEGYRTAEVTLGGVSTDEISSQTMMSKRQEGLFLIGEVVDVTGHLGGFNFQWAWASGWVAGCAV